MSTLLESLTGLTLLQPWMLLAALLVPAALWLRVRNGRPDVLFGPASLLPPEAETSSWRVRLVALPVALQATGLLLCAFALARPVERTRVPLRTEGIDILLCIDTSSSMTAGDMLAAGTRLDVAKDAAVRFVRGRPDDRIGLVTFARYPDVRCPPTLDHGSLARIIGDVTTVESDGPEDATGIGAAVARAAQVLRGSAPASASRVAIVLTDGEENVAGPAAPREIAPLHAAQLCRELGVRVYAIVAGSGRAGGGGAIDTRPMQELADLTGGRFFRARDAGAVTEVYAHVDALEKAALETPRFAVLERFLPFVIAAAASLLAARLLGATKLDVTP